jgi:cytochrome c oxidase subunit 2
MWTVQHQEGQREINELHVPLGRPVKLIMTSQDVIHSFFVPAFRIKMDVVPGRYTTTWFEATKTAMGGRIVVMKPTEYENWLSGGTSAEPLAASGERLFQQLGCSGCHAANAPVQAPALDGLYGKAVPLQSGETVLADESYIRASILTPQRQIVAGYTPIMPPFQGQISEEGLLQLIAYIKSLGGERQPGQRTGR